MSDIAMVAVSEEAKAKKRAYGRAYQAARRLADPEAERSKYRAYYARNREQRIAKVREWRTALTPAVARERAWRIRLRRFYGIELEDFNALRASQGYRCAICRRHEEDIPKVRASDNSALFIDHDHANGAVRGLLCQSCNILVGHARESEEILRAAIDYIRRTAS